MQAMPYNVSAADKTTSCAERVMLHWNVQSQSKQSLRSFLGTDRRMYAG